MAAVNVSSNASAVFQSISVDLLGLTDKERLLRPLMFDMIDMMKQRIHVEGKASDGGQIGTYNKQYLKLRESKYKRDSSTKIIVSLTGQLEKDWSVIETEKGYGIGFKNVENLEKAINVQNIKGVLIFELSSDELSYANKFIEKQIEKALKGEQ